MNKESERKSLESHIAELETKLGKIVDKRCKYEQEEDEVKNQLYNLKDKLKELDRNSIEYHVGDILLKINKHFSYHDDIILLYELLEEIKPQGSFHADAIAMTLHSYDFDISSNRYSTTLNLTHAEEQENEFYILKSSAREDIYKLFDKYIISGVHKEEQEKALFKDIENLIANHNGKLLYNLIQETEIYR